MNDHVLIHYGKKGMKWGHRKAKISNVTTTEKSITKAKAAEAKIFKDKAKAGQSLVNNANTGLAAVKNVNTTLQKSKTVAPVKKPATLATMTDKELQTNVARLNMEKQYSDLTRVPQQVSRGQRNLETTMAIAGGVLTATSSAIGIALAIKQLQG